MPRKKSFCTKYFSDTDTNISLYGVSMKGIVRNVVLFMVAICTFCTSQVHAADSKYPRTLTLQLKFGEIPSGDYTFRIVVTTPNGKRFSGPIWQANALPTLPAKIAKIKNFTTGTYQVNCEILDMVVAPSSQYLEIEAITNRRYPISLVSNTLRPDATFSHKHASIGTFSLVK